jgi:hypothetical protein
MSESTNNDFENLPGDGPLDETDVSLRAYFARLSEEHLREYDPTWTDEQVVAWDGNFRSDGVLMLTCCERDVEVGDYREVLARHINYREELAAGTVRTRRTTAEHP